MVFRWVILLLGVSTTSSYATDKGLPRLVAQINADFAQAMEEDSDYQQAAEILGNLANGYRDERELWEPAILHPQCILRSSLLTHLGLMISEGKQVKHLLFMCRLFQQIKDIISSTPGYEEFASRVFIFNSHAVSKEHLENLSLFLLLNPDSPCLHSIFISYTSILKNRFADVGKFFLAIYHEMLSNDQRREIAAADSTLFTILFSHAEKCLKDCDLLPGIIECIKKLLPYQLDWKTYETSRQFFKDMGMSLEFPSESGGVFDFLEGEKVELENPFMLEIWRTYILSGNRDIKAKIEATKSALSRARGSEKSRITQYVYHEITRYVSKNPRCLVGGPYHNELIKEVLDLDREF